MTTITFATPSKGSPRILYDNLLAGGTLSASDEDPLGDDTGLAANAIDWLPYTAWSTASAVAQWIQSVYGSPVAANAVFLCRHAFSVSSSFTVRVGYSDDGVLFNSHHTEVYPAGYDGAIYFNFPEESHIGWRVTIIGEDIARSVAVASIGLDFEFEFGPGPGFTSPFMGLSSKLLGATTRAGNPLPVSRVQQGYAFSMQLDMISDAWLRSIWHPFKEHAEILPFAFWWNPTAYPEEAVLAWVENRSRGIRPDTYDSVMTASVSLSGLRGILK